MMRPVVLSEQIAPGCFAFALSYLVDHAPDLSALDARFKNDITDASAYDPRVMLKIVLLGYSQGIISSRNIAAACSRNVQFIAISGDSQPPRALCQACGLAERSAFASLRRPGQMIHLNLHGQTQYHTQ